MSIDIPTSEELEEMDSDQFQALQEEMADLPREEKVAAEKELCRSEAERRKQMDFTNPARFERNAGVVVEYLSVQSTRRAKQEIPGVIKTITPQEIEIEEEPEPPDGQRRTIIVDLETFSVQSQTSDQTQKIGDLFEVKLSTPAGQYDKPFQDRVPVALLMAGHEDWVVDGPFKYPSEEFFDDTYDPDTNPDEHMY